MTCILERSVSYAPGPRVRRRGARGRSAPPEDEDAGEFLAQQGLYVTLPVEQIEIDNHASRSVARYQPSPRERSSMSVILSKINQTGEVTSQGTQHGKFIR